MVQMEEQLQTHGDREKALWFEKPKGGRYG